MPEEILLALIVESDMILSRHNGIHMLHSDCQALRLMLAIVKAGGSVNLAEARRIHRRMKAADATGVYSRTPLV